MREIVDGLAKALWKKPLPCRIPASLAMSAGKVLSCFPYKRLSGLHATIQKWLAEDVYDTCRFEETYGFQTRTSLADGLKREVDWYKKQVLSAE